MNIKYIYDEVEFKLLSILYRANKLFRRIRHHIVNPRKEMRKAVFPSQWWDLETHIVEFHVQCVIEYVEREKCFEVISWNWNEEVVKTRKELQEAYNYATSGRAKLQKDISEAWDKIPLRDLSEPINAKEFHKMYEDVEAKELWLNECDTKFCKWVIDNRQILWT
jgi:hypothetical protein